MSDIKKLIKEYEAQLQELTTQRTVIENKIMWTGELLENLKKEAYKTDRAAEVKVEAETNEFADMDTPDAALLVLNAASPNDMHQKEIAREMFRRGWQCNSKTPDQTVGTALIRLKEDKKVVEKTGKGRFRVIKKLDMEGRRVKQQKEEEEEIPF